MRLAMCVCVGWNEGETPSVDLIMLSLPGIVVLVVMAGLAIENERKRVSESVRV